MAGKTLPSQFPHRRKSILKDTKFGRHTVRWVSHKRPELEDTERIPRDYDSSIINTSFEDTHDGQKFIVKINISSFKPDELIQIKTVGDYLLIHGKYNNGSTQKRAGRLDFYGKIELPHGVDAGNFQTDITKDGMYVAEAYVNVSSA